jgi:hypothetical protein
VVLAALAGLAIAAGQKPTAFGDRQFRGARSAKQDAGVCKVSFILHRLQLSMDPKRPIPRRTSDSNEAA